MSSLLCGSNKTLNSANLLGWSGRKHPTIQDNLRVSSHILPRQMTMKKCPFCAEEIKDTAIKCKHCGEFLDASDHPSLAEEGIHWYFRKSFILIVFLCVGPLALPLIWWRPQTSRAWKIGLTIGILIFSWILFQATMESIRSLKKYYELFEGL
jgi:hypothetical protein